MVMSPAGRGISIRCIPGGPRWRAAGRSGANETQVTSVPSRPDPTPAMLLAEADEVRAIVRAAREHLEMDIAFIGEFREGVRINRFIECVGDPPSGDQSETLLEETYCRRIVAGEGPGGAPGR